MHSPIPLHEIDAELRVLEEQLYDAGGEIDAQLDERLAELLDARDDRYAAYLAVIRRAESTAAAYEAEAKRLAALSKPHSATASRLRERLLASMLAGGETKAETPLGIVAVRRSGTRPVVLDVPEEQLPECFRRVVVSADKRAIVEALKAGDEAALAVAHLGEASAFLSIR